MSDDCCVLVAPKHLPLQGLNFVIFRTSSDTTMLLPEWMPDTDHMLQRLGGIKTFLQSVTSKHVGQSNNRVIQVIQADSLPHCPCMPTLHGFLLGYPAIYVVDNLEEAERASRCLSMSRLRLCSLIISLESKSGTYFRGILDDLGMKEITILSFSVPESLCSNDSDTQNSEPAWEAVLRYWLNRRRLAAVEDGGVPWGEVSVRQTTKICSVAL